MKIDPKNKTYGSSIERFGMTESRFRVPTDVKIFRIKYEFKKETPGPGAYHDKDNKEELEERKTAPALKGSYVFSSKSKREGPKADKGGFFMYFHYKELKGIVPAPGTYDTSHYNLSTKVKKPEKEEEALGLVPKKPPFNTAVERFKKAAVQIGNFLFQIKETLIKI